MIECPKQEFKDRHYIDISDFNDFYYTLIGERLQAKKVFRKGKQLDIIDIYLSGNKHLF